MNYLDLIIGLFLFVAIIQGYRHGLIKSLASLAALILGIYAGIKLSGIAADLLTKHTDISKEYLFVIGFIFVFIVVVILVSLIGKLLDKIASMAALGFLNKLLGLLFGLVKGIIILSVIITVYDFVDPHAKIINEETRESSMLYKPIGTIVPTIIVNIRGDDLEIPAFVNTIKSKTSGENRHAL
jgi:membrane protein required for colicin V production